MNSQLKIVINYIISLLLISNMLSLLFTSGVITYPEIHYGYKDKPYKEIFWRGAQNESNTYAIIDSFENIFVTCSSNSFSVNPNVVVIKFNPNMNHIWNKTWPTVNVATPAGIVVDNNSNCYIAGTITRELNNTNKINNAFLLKFNTNGTRLWNITQELDDQNDNVSSLALDNLGNVYVIGNTNSSLGSLFIQKYSTNGSYKNTFYYGLTSPKENVLAGKIIIDSKNDIVIAAGTNKTIANDYDVALIKLNSTTGLPYWNVTFGGTSYDKGISLAVKNDNIYVVGYYSSVTESDNILLINFNATNGEEIWNSTLNMSNEQGFGLIINRHHNPVITGFTDYYDPDNDIIIAEFNQTGHLIWNATWGDSYFDNSKDITYYYQTNTNIDFIYAIGETFNSTTKLDVVIIVYEDDTEYLFPIAGPYGRIFGIIFGILMLVFSSFIIAVILLTYWKKS